MLQENRFLYKGAIHIHSTLSDGTGDINTISLAAKKAGLDFIIITDHNHFDTDEGIINGVYVIKAQEVSPHSCNHYLAFGINETVLPEENPQKYVDKVRELGGFGFAAHADEGTSLDKNGNLVPRKNSNHCIPWLDKNVKPDGVEIWNWFSAWADNLDDSNIFKLAYAYLFKHNLVKKPSNLTLSWWDKLNNETINVVAGIGGVDAHALKFYKYIIPVTVFPYKTCFNTITNVICLDEKLSENFEQAKAQIFNAIKRGNNIIVNRHVYRKIPKINISDSEKVYYCGENIKLNKGCCLNFEADKKMEICLIYNGKELQRLVTDKFNYQVTECGKYRLEVLYKGKGYLYTNPFNIKDVV